MSPADLEAPAHRRTPFGQYQRASIADLPEPYLARLARQGFPRERRQLAGRQAETP